MNYFLRPLAVAFAAALLATGCARQELAPTQPVAAAASQQDAAATGFPETFETGTKAAYTSATVALSSGSWTFDDALLGNSTADVKTGAQSARLRNSGKLTMNFSLTSGAGVVTIAHARYGTDAATTWELWASTNGGSSYTKVGSTITASSTTLATASFTVNLAGSVRLQVRKTDGTTNRLNLDNLTVQTYGGGTTPPATTGKKFLFDGSHAETAGNADWIPDADNGVVARFPTPAQSGITASTTEGYWTGGLSSWGVALVKLGNTVESLPTGTAITYGNASNPQDLSNYNVFVVDEPNTLFTATEKAAIVNFVKNGGGLFMISDHTVSDRNNDGQDSPAIWNDLMTNNSVQANPFGFKIDLTNISETSINVLSSNTNVVLHGSQGNVTQLKFSNGATITTTSTAAQPLIWQGSAAQGTTKAMCATSTYGTGRVFVITDSSPADDGTGASGDTLYPGWTEIGSHAPLHLNASLWLAKQQ
ncbi:hydrolase [Hymenobacter sp. HMF4947]|uniref:Hydrolase n=1 Tax=Hymenobacter ginkgonis TaxID=2682976 RepID=A0A7K1TC11_9BACT|nr:hydrolase [Hymenobacter ginkgonis]MVN75946.1 hydrolase [Hymenobacter ginkgonis]